MLSLKTKELLKVFINIKLKVKVILILFCLFLNSCSSKYKDALQGIWAINKINYKGEDMPIQGFYTNILVFKKDGKCIIPIDQMYQKEEGTYEIINNDGVFCVKINVPDSDFNDVYRISFINENFSTLHLVSNEVFIEATKF